MAKGSARGSGGGGIAAKGVAYVRGSSSRQTAFLLIVAILLARLALTNQLQQFWGAMWGPVKPLGQGLPAKADATAKAKT